MPEASREASSTEGSPVVARRKSAAPIAPATLRLLHVETDRSLAAVRRMEAGVYPSPGATDSGGDQTTVRIAGLRVLDLDDVGTPLVEDRAGHGNEDVRGDLHDADAGERSGHGHLRLVVHGEVPAPTEL